MSSFGGQREVELTCAPGQHATTLPANVPTSHGYERLYLSPLSELVRFSSAPHRRELTTSQR